jgi:hypothetical protein
MGKLQVIASANANSGNRFSSFSFTGISSSYTDLMLYLTLRSTSQGGQQVTGIIYYNNDQSQNYSNQELLSTGITTQANTYFQTQGEYRVPADLSNSSQFGSAFIYIPNYAVTNLNKTNLTNSTSALFSSANQSTYTAVNRWNSTASINRIDIYVNSGGLMQYSAAYLYGINSTP